MYDHILRIWGFGLYIYITLTIYYRCKLLFILTLNYLRSQHKLHII